MTEQRFTVRCEDGGIRHSAPFTSRREAEQFAHWGHCCTSEHTIMAFLVDVPVTA